MNRSACILPDRPAPAPDEIEVTPEMIEAGFEEFFAGYEITEPTDMNEVRRAVAAIYRAMHAQRLSER
jgi:hypothetical protein